LDEDKNLLEKLAQWFQLMTPFGYNRFWLINVAAYGWRDKNLLESGLLRPYQT
jgi:hypothetical protein